MAVNTYFVISVIIISIIIIAICVIIWYLLSKKHEKFTSVQNDYLGNKFRSVQNDYLKNMKIYIINLENRPDRKENSKILLDKLGFTNYQFVVPFSKDEAVLDPILVGSTSSQSGLSLTSTVLTIFRETQEEEFIIMEDDLKLNENVNCSFEDIYNSAKDVEWDLLYFEFCSDKCNHIKKVRPCLFKLYAPYCAAFIMFKKSATNKILNNFDENAIIDVHYSFLSKEGILSSYGYPLLRQNPQLGSNLEGSPKYNDGLIGDPICWY
jgi:hypothetical protein